MAVAKEVQKLLDKKPHQLTEEDYNSRWDAETLIRAEEVRLDDARLAKAILWAKVIQAQEGDKKEAINTVANA